MPSTTARPLLDRIDRRIVEELVAHARMSNRQLAEKIGVAPSTALVRTQGLIDRGVLTGFTASIDLASVGRTVQALVAVRLGSHDRDAVAAFEEHTTQLPEVVTSFHTAGAVEYLFYVAVPSTTALRDWVFEHFTMNPIVSQTETTLVFEHTTGNPAVLP